MLCPCWFFDGFPPPIAVHSSSSLLRNLPEARPKAVAKFMSQNVKVIAGRNRLDQDGKDLSLTLNNICMFSVERDPKILADFFR